MKCDRTDCFAHTEKYDNNCNALSETYRNSSKCPFFKTKEEVEFQKKKLAKRNK